MNQLTTQALGVPLGRSSHLADMYVYDIDHRDGVANMTLKLQDLDGLIGLDNMGHTAICPVDTGCCVKSVTGGVVAGYDMYGQLIRETVGAAGTGTIAFASIISAPADTLWANVFGLPYKRLSGDVTGITFTIWDADEDSRGTFVVDAGITDPVEIELTYLADKANPMGDAYATRFASDDLNSDPIVVAGTIDTDGVCTLIVPVPTDLNDAITVVWGDGATTDETAHATTEVVHVMNEVWMSKYAKEITDTLVDQLTAVNFASNATPGIYVDYSGLPATGQTAAELYEGPFPSTGSFNFWIEIANGNVGFDLNGTEQPPANEFWVNTDPNLTGLSAMRISDINDQLTLGGYDLIP